MPKAELVLNKHSRIQLATATPKPTLPYQQQNEGKAWVIKR